MRVVVTGASGNVGTAFLRAVASHEQGWTVTGIARRRPPDHPPFTVADWVLCDLGAEEATEPLREALSGADALVHLAWAIQPGVTEASLHRTNITGTRRVLRLVAEAGTPQLVYVSSVAAYAPAPRSSRVDENHPCTGIPGSAYSQDKARLEWMISDFVEQSPGTLVAGARPAAVVQREAGAEFARRVLSPLIPPKLLGLRVLPIPLWRSLRAQIVHAEDVAEALWSMLTRQAHGPFNLAAEPVLTADDLAAELGGFRVPAPRTLVSAAALATWRAGVQPLHPSWLSMADQVALVDTGRARAELSWTPRYDSVSAVRELIAGIREGTGTGGGPMAPRDAGTGRPQPGRARLGAPSHQSQADTGEQAG